MGPMPDHQPVILPYGDTWPDVHETAFIAPTAVLIGETEVQENASVFYNCVLRGDINRIVIGAGTNIQDLTMVHVDGDYPCLVGREVTVGHCAVLHGCVIGDHCLIGMGAVVMTGAVVGAECIIAAGAVVPEHMQIPPRSLVAGVPARVKKQLDDKTVASLPGWALKYQKVAKAFQTGTAFRANFIGSGAE